MPPSKTKVIRLDLRAGLTVGLSGVGGREYVINLDLEILVYRTNEVAFLLGSLWRKQVTTNLQMVQLLLFSCGTCMCGTR
jgi:hypothetical protein